VLKVGGYHQATMKLESLLLSRDPEVIRVLRPALEKLSIALEVCRGARSGTEIISTEKFDAIIIDCDDLQGGLEVLTAMRKGSSNKSSIAFAILNGQTTTQKAFELGANFVIQKPLSPLNTMRCFSAAINFMLRERRRYFRQPVEMLVTIVFGEKQEFKATATNLSEGGMAIYFRGNLPRGGISRVVFSLPGAPTPLQPRAHMAWLDGAGRAGLRFMEMPKDMHAQLDRWLTEQFNKLEKPQNQKN
jgi:CheY-like chemotaxis protein